VATTEALNRSGISPKEIEDVSFGNVIHNGNKRTAYAATKAFLKLNGDHLRMPTEEGIDFMVGVAQKKYEVPKEIASILKQYCT
jgi:death-on-curing protein